MAADWESNKKKKMMKVKKNSQASSLPLSFCLPLFHSDDIDDRSPPRSDMAALNRTATIGAGRRGRCLVRALKKWNRFPFLLLRPSR